MKRLLALLLLLSFTLAPLSALAERDYLIRDSDTRELTEQELWSWTRESLGYILNEIFARHGYVFEAGGKYERYFKTMPWYAPNQDPDNSRACYSQLTSVEWRNESLVKSVYNQMVALGTRNEGAQSVWDGYSSGFDTLQGFEYVKMPAVQTLNVYSCPSAQSWRGAKGKAQVSTNGRVFAAGWENGWLLVMYETNHNSVRVGYVDGQAIRGNVPLDTMLFFDYAPATVNRACALTDDPAKSNQTIRQLAVGEQVTYLTAFFNRTAWAYIETTADGLPVRGFIPADALDNQDTEALTAGDGFTGK